MQSQKRKRYQKDAAPPDDIITLIHLVRMNPVLYNYKLQPNQRRRADILSGWAQIAAQIGNKYTVEECRRKWKNLRDTYHQYRLRKPKLIDGGLTKWRYAKELEFLSNVYQPKLKSNRQMHQFDAAANLLIKHDDDDQDEHVANGIVHHNSTPISLDCGETFILTAYEEDGGVNDDVTTIDHHQHHHHHQQQHHHHHQTHSHHHHSHNPHDDPNMVNMELTHDDDDGVGGVVENGMEIVKNEHNTSLGGDEDDCDDGAQGAEVDYEEVCLYEEAGNAPSVDCETIVDASSVGHRTTSADSKDFQYIDANDFCIGSIGGSSRSHFSTSSTSVLGGGNVGNVVNGSVVTTKLTKLSLVSVSGAQTLNSIPITVTTPTTTTVINTNPTLASAIHGNSSSNSSSTQQALLTVGGSSSSGSSSATLTPLTETVAQSTRAELDLFFDFLKQKIQRFSKSEITSIQVEFLNCVLRREHAQRNDANSIELND